MEEIETSKTPKYDKLNGLKKEAVDREFQEHLKLERLVNNPLPDRYYEQWAPRTKEGIAGGSPEDIEALVKKHRTDIAEAKARGALNGVSGGEDSKEYATQTAKHRNIPKREPGR